MAASTLTLSPTLRADDPLLFVSSFSGGEKGAISAFRISLEDGSLTPLARTGDIENPFFLAVSPDQRFLYAVHTEAFGGDENEEVAAYAIDPASGGLALLNRQSAQGTATCYLEVDHAGKTLLLANYSSGSVAALPIREDGSLGEVTSFTQHEGGSRVDPKRQSGPHAHSIIVSPGNHFACAADLGLDRILVYRLDETKAELEPLPASAGTSLPGSGPRHLAYFPENDNSAAVSQIYAIDELSNAITRFSQDAETGSLTRHEVVSTLPEDFEGTSHCADLKFTPDGKFLYGTNRGHDSIAIFRTGKDFALTRVGIVPSLGKGPQNLLVTPDGKWLLCANMPGNNLVVFRIDPDTGNLTPAGAPHEITMPSSIRLLP